MPPLRHWPDRELQFRPEESEVLDFICKACVVADLVVAARAFDWARMEGVLRFNSDTMEWAGADYDACLSDFSTQFSEVNPHTDMARAIARCALPATFAGVEGHDSGRAVKGPNFAVFEAPKIPVIRTSGTDLHKAAQACTGSFSIALDIETYGPGKHGALNPWRGDIRLLTIKPENGPVFLLDLMAIGYDLEPLAAALEGAEIIAHNARFDLLWLAVKCEVRPKRVFCTLTASRLLSAGTTLGNNLEQCLERYLGICAGSDQSRSDWGGMFLTGEQLAYAARDVEHLHVLADTLTADIEEAGFPAILDLEMKLLPVVVAMEEAGFRVDAGCLQALRDEARAGCSLMRIASVWRWTIPPSTHRAHSNSRRLWIGSVSMCRTRGKKLSKPPVTGKSFLSSSKCVVRKRQRSRLTSCLNPSSATDASMPASNPPARTPGVSAAKAPISKTSGGGRLRACFVPAPGHILIVADYSQIELRAAAAIAGEGRMIEAYRRGEDLHKLTAATVLGKPLEEVTKDDRQLSTDRAEAIRRAFFRTYAALRQWHGLSHNLAEEGIGEVRTRMGRRRLIPEDNDDWQRFTALVNTPVQGACADGMKLAIVLLSERLPDSARIVSTVHDELIIEVPEAQATTLCELVRTTMIEAMAGIFPEVPIEVEAGVCRNWSEK